MPYMKNMQAILRSWVDSNIFYGVNDLTIGIPITIRTRTLIAAVNAGATLLPALVGFAYRIIDASMISVGGAAGATTTVDILGTLTTSRKILSVAIAALTQSALVRAGAANATILADGASFTRNDVNTAITIGKTGASLTTSVSIDTIITYVIEPEAI